MLGALAITLAALLELGLLEYTYGRLGIRHRVFTGLLLLSLVGSVVNVPVGRLRVAGAPGDGATRGPLVALNVGGALIPTLLALYVLIVHRLFLSGAAAIAAVALLSHRLARPVPGVGIAVPLLVPPIAAAVLALLLAPDAAAALAYAAGTVGTLIGADLANLRRLRELGAPVVSIGGGGTFDAVFLTGLLAVLLA